MEYSILCTECIPYSDEQFTINVSPNNDGVYNVTCPHGHKFKLDILSHHFQILFENGLSALNDNYYIEAISSFTACYERFQEYFIKIVLLSRKISLSEYSKTWKNVSKHSERQLGAFIFIYLNEFGIGPILIAEKNTTLRNNVLEVIRPIIKLLKVNDIYDKELISSKNASGNFENSEIRHHYTPYQIFAINRPINSTDEKSVLDFLNDNKKQSIT